MKFGDRLAITVIIAAIVAAFFLWYAQGDAAQYYVKTGGNNASAGTSLATAWGSLGKACSTAVAGDTVNIVAGTWSTGISNSGSPVSSASTGIILRPVNSGTSAAPIVYRSYPDSAKAKLDGNNYTLDGVILYLKHHIIIQNIEVTKCSYGVVFFTTDTCSMIGIKSHHNSLSADDNGCGLHLYHSTDTLGTGLGWNYGNVIRACTSYSNYGMAGYGGTTNCGGITCYWQHSAIIESCLVYGGDSTQYPMGIRMKVSSRNCTIRDNLIYNFTTNNAIFIQQGGRNDSIYRNVIYNSLEGINIRSYTTSGAHSPSCSIYVFNNTIYRCTQQGINVGDDADGSDTANTYLKIWNNLVISCSNNLYLTNRAHSFGLLDSNCYWNPTASTVVYWKGLTYTSVATYSAAQGYDQHSVQVYPVFVDTLAAGGRDFHLTASSPASVWSMGAYTYSAGEPDQRILTWRAKRALTSSSIPDSEATGYTAPDSTNPVDWHPQFNMKNVTGYTSDSIRVLVMDSSYASVYDWKTAAVVTNSSRSSNITYPTGSGVSILQSGPKYNYAMAIRSNSVWTWTDTNSFWGIIPDNIDTLYPGYRSVVPIYPGGKDHTALSLAHTVTVPFPTGWGRVIDSTAVNNMASPSAVHYGGFSYINYERIVDSTGLSWISLLKGNDSSGTWSTPKNVLPGYPADYAHFFSRGVVDDSGHLFIIRAAHPETEADKILFARTKSVHIPGQGIDIEDTSWYGGWGQVTSGTSTIKRDTSKNWTMNLYNWTFAVVKGTGIGNKSAIDANGPETLVLGTSITTDTSSRYVIYQEPTSMSGAYPDLYLVNGTVYCFFRWRYIGIGGGNPVYSYFVYTKYVNGTWSDKRYIVHYPDCAYNVKNSTYFVTYNMPGTLRMHVVITFRDDYTGDNQDRGSAHLYSDLDANGEFTTWYQFSGDTGKVVGYRRSTPYTDTVKSDSSIIYRDLDKFFVCNNSQISKQDTGTGDNLYPPFMLVTQDHGMVSTAYNDRVYITGTVYSDSATGSYGTLLYSMLFYYNKSLAEWIRISLSGQTKFSAKTTGDHRGYNIDIDAGSVAGTIKLIVKNKWTAAETTETFDSLSSISDLWTAVNHGLAGRNDGNPSSLINIDWVGDSLPPYCAQESLKYGAGTNLYCYNYVTDTSQWLPNGLRQNRLIIEDDYRRLFCYGAWNPTTWQGYNAGEIYRQRFDEVGTDNFPIISRKALTGSSGKGQGNVVVIQRVAYGNPIGRSQFTPNYKELFVSRGRDLVYLPDKFVVSLPSGKDVRVIFSYIDANNSVKTSIQRNRVVEDQFFMRTSKLAFRTGVSIPANWENPTNGCFTGLIGNDTVTSVADTASKVFANITIGKGFEGFESYASGYELDNSGDWISTPANCSAYVFGSTLTDNGYITPYQGSNELFIHDSANCEMAINASGGRKTTVFVAFSEEIGRPYFALKSKAADGVDTNAVFLGIDGVEQKAIYRHVIVYNKDSIKAVGASSVTQWINGESLYVSDNRNATIAANIGAQDTLRGYTPNFALPTNATIKGIKVLIEGKCDSAITHGLYVRLTKNNYALYGTAKACSLKVGSDSVITLGNSSDMWGTSANVDSVNASGFGVMLSRISLGSTNHRSKLYIDQMRMEVIYTVPNSDTDWVTSSVIVAHGAPSFTGNYQKMVISNYSDTSFMYVNDIFVAKYPMTTFNTICLGSARIVVGGDTSSHAAVTFDAVQTRNVVANEPEPSVWQSAEQILGSEDIQANYRRRLMLLK